MDTSNWGIFQIEDIFKIDSGTKLDRGKMPTGNDINFIGRSGVNNGINATTTYVEGITPYEPGLISLSLGGTVGACFVQDKKFYTSQNVVVLKPLPNIEIPHDAKHFVTTCIYKESQLNYKAFVKELNKHIKRDFYFRLPQTFSGNPDWDYMDNFIKERKKLITKGFINTFPISVSDRKLDTTTWGEFQIEDIFKDIRRPVNRKVNQYIPGDVPFVSSGNYDNAVDSYCKPLNDEELEKGNCISVSPVDGSTFYQPNDFLGRGGGGSSIILLYDEQLNEYNGLFVSAIIRSYLSKKYAYGDMGNSTTIKKELIKLPSKSNGEPDWGYMENYIRVKIQEMKLVINKLKSVL